MTHKEIKKPKHELELIMVRQDEAENKWSKLGTKKNKLQEKFDDLQGTQKN